MTKDQPKSIPMPRAKIGDVILIQLVAGFIQHRVLEAHYVPEKGWKYKIYDNEFTRNHCLESEILLNLTTGIDYQEEEKKKECTHEWQEMNKIGSVACFMCTKCNMGCGLPIM